MNSGKVYTDFMITKPQNSLENFKPQLDFTHKHFETIWSIIEKMSNEISKMSFVQNIGNEERTKLGRYAVLKALQDFEHFGTGKIEMPKFPKRKDGGWWFAQAIAFDAGYNMKEYNKASEYMIHGGHRTTEAFVEGGTRRVRLYEFDTMLWDSPHRYSFVAKFISNMLFHCFGTFMLIFPLKKNREQKSLTSLFPTCQHLKGLE